MMCVGCQEGSEHAYVYGSRGYFKTRKMIYGAAEEETSVKKHALLCPDVHY